MDDETEVVIEPEGIDIVLLDCEHADWRFFHRLVHELERQTKAAILSGYTNSGDVYEFPISSGE